MTYAASSPAKRELPAAFVEFLSQHEQLSVLKQSLADSEPEVSVRLNRGKAGVPGMSADTVPWCAQGVYLPQRPAFTLDPALHQGLYYVQDASSMILQAIAAHSVTDGEPVRWLDACAAPGGKTTAIADVLPADSLLVANEYDAKRARALVENVERWGNPDIMVTTGDTAQFSALAGFFDVISVDAPCSGEGMMRKEEVAVTQWSPALVQQCAALQRQIIGNLWPALRPGGTMIYSTCTFNTTENEENVLWAINELGAESVALHMPGTEAVSGALAPFAEKMNALRFLPGAIRGEGLFVAVLRKPGNQVVAKVAMPRKFDKTKLPDNRLVGHYIGVQNNDMIYALPEATFAARLRIAQAVRTVLPGIAVGVQKGKDVIPTQALATSSALNRDAFACENVDGKQALAFLRGEPMQLPVQTQRGFVLLLYKQQPLGFVKNIGNRWNNLLPDNRRIRMHADEAVDVLSTILSPTI